MKKALSEKEREMKRLNNERKKEVICILKEMEIEDIQCGIGCCKPRWFQYFATKELYLVVYCIVGLVIGMFFTYSVSTVSTIEKRFKLTSKQTGVIFSGNDVSQIFLSIIVAYYGNYGNRPKWLGVGVLSASFSCFLSAVPHFVYGPGRDALELTRSMSVSNSSLVAADLPDADDSTAKHDLCYDPYISDCSEGGSDVAQYFLGPVVILFLSEFFVGVAITVFYSLGLIYLDDNVNKKDSPMYYSVSMMIRVIGPVLGFFLGSKCLQLYIIPKYKPNLSLRDPRWLGAWWLGYIVLGFLLAICGLFIFFFPRVLPSTLYKQIRRKHNEDASDPFPLTKESNIKRYLEEVKQTRTGNKPSLKKLPSALKRLFRNKIWVGYNLNTVLAILALMGYWSFKPKYLEFQFRKSASEATFYTGIASLVASLIGFGISGLVLRFCRPHPRFVTGYSCFLTIFSSLSLVGLMFIGCPKLDIVGPNSNTTDIYCNDGCGCTERYSPVCSEDGLTTFYSPCYAGCTAVNPSSNPVEYLNCSCVSPVTVDVPGTKITNAPNFYEVSNAEPSPDNGRTIQGYCPESCDSFKYYIMITILTKTIDATGRIGSTLVYLRSVEEQDKGLALGATTVLISLFAFIPAPIIMGAVVDSACIIWDNTCGLKGNCWLYDSDTFRKLIHGFPATILLLSLIGDCIVFINSHHLILYGEDEEEHRKSHMKKNGVMPMLREIEASENREMRPFQSQSD